MSQINVERVIGVLVTDEALRKRFLADPEGTLRSLIERGLELNGCEQRALAAIDPFQLARFAEAIDARLQKSDLRSDLDSDLEGSSDSGAAAAAPAIAERQQSQAGGKLR